MNSMFHLIKKYYLHIVLLNIMLTWVFYSAIPSTAGIAGLVLLPWFVGMASTLLKMARSEKFSLQSFFSTPFRREVIVRNILVMLIVYGIPFIVAFIYLRYFTLINLDSAGDVNNPSLDSSIAYVREWVLFGLRIWLPSMVVASFLSFVPYVLADADEDTKISTIFSRALSLVFPQVVFIFLLRLFTFMRALPLYAAAALFTLVLGGFADDGGEFVSVTIPAIFYWGLLITFVFGPLYHIGVTLLYEKRVQKEREMEDLEYEV